jgi:hypothetical protein
MDNKPKMENEPKYDAEYAGAALCRAYADKRNHDLKLVATDGTVVGAIKAVVRGCSTMMEAMLNPDSNFKESQTSTVQTKLVSTVLSELVTFIHTGRWGTQKRKATDGDIKPACNFETTMSLLEAAKFYEVDKLRQKILKHIPEVMDEYPLAAFRVFDMLHDSDKEDERKMAEMALEFICSVIGQIVTKNSFDRDVVCPISCEAMHKILKDGRLHAPELSIFNFLQLWSTGTVEAEGDRKKSAMKLVEHIKFEKIHTGALEKEVLESGLVTDKKMISILFAALKKLESDEEKEDESDEEKEDESDEEKEKEADPFLCYRNPWTNKMYKARGNGTPTPTYIKIVADDFLDDEVVLQFHNAGMALSLYDHVTYRLDVRGGSWHLEEIIPEKKCPWTGDVEEWSKSTIFCAEMADVNDPCPRPSDKWYKAGDEEKYDADGDEEKYDAEFEIKYHYG